MEVIYLGGAHEVGASSILIKLSGHNILLDSGIRQKGGKDKLPDFCLISEHGGIEAIIVSHAHMDHIGSLPLISKEFPSVRIYMNKMTLELSRVLLYDSLKVMRYHDDEIPIFNEDDVLNMFNKVEVVPYQKEVSIFDDFSLTFYMAGHIAGASVAYLKTKEGTLLYTGDFSLFNQHAIAGLSIPKLRPDIVISEATYGNRLHANREVEEMRLIDTVSDVITSGGKVIIPVFALGRSQEVLLILKRSFNKKQLPLVNVYVDGMVRNINTTFMNNPLYLKESLGKRILKGIDIFYNDYIVSVTDDKMRKEIIESDKPLIILASSGMLTGGMSEYYASYLVGDNKNAIILTGYQDEESNGSVLLNLLEEPEENRVIKLNNKVRHVSCKLAKVGLSAHADKQEIKSLFNTLKPKHIILGHGDEDAINSLATEITKELGTNVYVPRVGDIVNIKIRNPRLQINHSLKYLYSGEDSMEQFYQFIKEHYQERLLTKEDLAYIYYGQDPKTEDVDTITNKLIESPYFTQDRRRYFLFKVTDELELLHSLNKEITNQEIETIIKDKFSSFPYRKISYYLNEKRVVMTFDFPKVISQEFDNIAKTVYDDTGIMVEKNDNINNLACETKIKEIIGTNNINKISYLPNEDKFRVKVYTSDPKWPSLIKESIGYDAQLVQVPKPDNTTLESNINLKEGSKLEQNDALNYIDNYFLDKPHKPYKKSLKNGNIILSFITYQIGLKYQDDIQKLSDQIGWTISLNHSANMNALFTTIDDLLMKYNITKLKNPSFIANENKVIIKLSSIRENTKKEIMEEFTYLTGLELDVQ